ncbi:MAG: peptidylprolyl isomerase [Desulfobulbaceae bacterium]
MLEILRKQAQSTVIQALVLIIAIVFVFWGVGTNLGSRRNALATVNGVEIPYEDFQRAYDTAVDNLRVQFGGSIPQGIMESLNMERQVLNQLIQAEILRQGAREMGLSVSEVATRDEIRNMEIFQQNGRFDLNRYKEILAQNRMTPTTFEAGLSNDLLTRRATAAIDRFALVPESEIAFRYAFANEEIKIAYAQFKASDFKDEVTVDEEKLAAWYEENSKKYLTDPQVRLRYLFFSFEDDKSSVELTEEQLRAAYEMDRDRYRVPEQRHARHILFKVNENDDVETRTAKKKKAEEVLAMAREGKDFVELARTYSEGPTAKNGGDLGFFGRGAMVEQFESAVFSMQPGEISDVVETVFGYHIIRLEEIRPETTRAFEEVRASIEEKMRAEKVAGVTRDRARKAYEDIIRAGSLEKYVEEHAGEVNETDFFARKNPPGPPISDPALLQVAFKLKKGELSSLVKTSSGYAILFVDDIRPPETPELADVRERVVADYTRERSVELAREAAQKVLDSAREGKTLTEEILGKPLQESPFIKRTNPVDAGGVPVAVVQQAFEMTPANPLPEKPYQEGDAFYVFQLVEKRQGEQELDETQRQVLAEQLARDTKNRLLTDWLAWLRSDADIWINEQFLQ